METKKCVDKFCVPRRVILSALGVGVGDATRGNECLLTRIFCNSINEKFRSAACREKGERETLRRGNPYRRRSPSTSDGEGKERERERTRPNDHEERFLLFLFFFLFIAQWCEQIELLFLFLSFVRSFDSMLCKINR